MATCNGQLVICDRCGKTAFRKCTGEGETDGGYTRWNNFEKLEGWEVEAGIGNMCPRCATSYHEVFEQFKKGILGTPIYDNQEAVIDVL